MNYYPWWHGLNWIEMIFIPLITALLGAIFIVIFSRLLDYLKERRIKNDKKT